METNKDFAIPEGLSGLGRKAAETIITHVCADFPDASGGGCRAFYTPDEWRARGEQYGADAELIVVHDGGDLAPYFSYDECCYDLLEGMVEALSPTGTYAEQCTCWYTAIYPA
jgi:hypothetical protein